MIWCWITELLYLHKGMEAEQQKIGLKLVKQIFIGRITTILYLVASRKTQAPYRLLEGRHLHKMTLLYFVTTICAKRLPVKHQALQLKTQTLPDSLKQMKTNFKATRRWCVPCIHHRVYVSWFHQQIYFFLRGKQVKVQLLIDDSLY